MANSWLAAFCSNPIGARLAFYPTLLYGMCRINSSRTWYNRIDDKVILGALPLHKVAKELVAKENVQGVVTLNEDYETRYICPNEQEWRELGVSVCRIPTVDFNNSPSLYQIKTSLDFIDSCDDNSSVYVHCKAGRSRSATVVLSYLIRKNGMTPEDAVAFVQNTRPHIVLGSEHRKRIKEFYKTRLMP